MKGTISTSAVHPMVIFWLGLLTGAVIVSLTFLYRILIPSDFESSIFRNSRMPKNFDNNKFSEQLILPKDKFLQGIDERAFPSPTPEITF